jgi:hypothetical protein
VVFSLRCSCVLNLPIKGARKPSMKKNKVEYI